MFVKKNFLICIVIVMEIFVKRLLIIFLINFVNFIKLVLFIYFVIMNVFFSGSFYGDVCKLEFYSCYYYYYYCCCFGCFCVDFDGCVLLLDF